MIDMPPEGDEGIPYPETAGAQCLHLWWELSYAQYLTIPRSIMQAMPDRWQGEMASLLRELDDGFNWRPEGGSYWCRLRDEEGRFVDDRLAEYRHPDRAYIESLRIDRAGTGEATQLPTVPGSTPLPPAMRKKVT